MAETYLAYPGTPVTIKGERFKGEDDYYAPYNLKYSPGQAHILNVYKSWDEIPEDSVNELKKYLGEEKFKEYVIETSVVNGAKLFLDLRVGLTDVWIVPDYDLEGTAEYRSKTDLKEDVEKYLAEREKKKEFKDTGKRASSTSKEKAAWAKVVLFSVGDLESLEKSKGLLDLIKKDRVWARINIDSEKDKGVFSGAAFMKTKLREFYPPRPVVDTPAGRKIYIEAANRLSDAIADVVDLKDFNENVADKDDLLFDAILNSIPDTDGEDLKDALQALQKEYKDVLKKRGIIMDGISTFNDNMREKYGFGETGGYKAYTHDRMDAENIKEAEVFNEGKKAIEELKDNLQRASYVLSMPKYSIIQRLKDELEGVSLYYLYDYEDVKQKSVKYYFDKRFLDFFWKGSKYEELYKKAEKFGEFSQEDFDRKVQPEIDRLREYIKNIEDKNATLTIDKPYPEIRKSLEQGSVGFWEGQFPYDIYSKIPPKLKGTKKVHISGSTILGLDPAIFPRWMDAAKVYFDLMIEYKNNSKKEYEKRIETLIADNPIREGTGDDWSWAEKTPDENEKKEKAKDANTAIQLTYIKRTGGYDTSMVDNAETAREFIMDIFGFGGFTGGATLKDEDARNHIRYFTGAISDLGEILNLDIKTLNKKGNLLYALGAYGGQRTLAFFRHSPGENLISFTKTRGDGTVCHEYGHYLDFLMGGFTGFLSDSNIHSYKGKVRIFSSDYYWSETKKAMNKIINFIFQGYGNGNSVNQKIKLTVPEKYTSFSNSPDLKIIFESSADIDTALSKLRERFSRYKGYENLKPSDMAVFYTILSHYGYTEYEVEFKMYSSQFYAASKALDETRSKPYWGTPRELFARSFETYIFDKLDSQGRVNNYLVSGNFDLFPDNVYPSGDERKHLFGLFENLFTAFKADYQIPDFVASWTDKKTDDYTDLNDNSEISVDADTGETVNTKTDKENIGKMFKQLIRMMKKA